MKLLFAAALLLTSAGTLGAQSLVVRSPDNNLEIAFSVDSLNGERGDIFYAVKYKSQNVVLKSQLGVLTTDIPSWVSGFAISGSFRRSVDETWKPVYGERSTVRDRYNECTVSLIQNADTARRIQVVIRVYNEGAAFCYRFPEAVSTSVLNIRDEKTEFAFEDSAVAYVTPFAQELYRAAPLRDWSYEKLPLPRWAARTPEYESERPLTLSLRNGLFVSIGEAALVNYSRMKFVLSAGKKNTVVARLSGPVTESSHLQTPWRAIMVAEKPGDLIDHDDIFLNLNGPCEIKKTGWIKPGKVIREVTLTTAGAKECVDFCVKHNMQYVEFDAGWYGNENSKSSDASKANRKDLDLKAAIAYARVHGVGVFLYVNHRALESQIDEIFPLYREWGVAGLKFGFVHVGSHRWTAWVHEAVRKAARYGLMVDIHDEYRPTGYSRTYPNLLTQEGVYGNECMPEADHNTILPFTRFLAGAADYTICYYYQKGIKDVPGIKTTSAHQLALSVVFYSPLQFLFWYDRPSDYQGEPEVEFFEKVPTVWDTTRVLMGEIGKFIVTARRSGRSWFVGAITNNEGRVLNVPLSFLDEGTTYLVSVYADGRANIQSRTKVGIGRFLLQSKSAVRADLKPSGGMAMEIHPATEDDIRNFGPGKEPSRGGQ